MHNRTWSKFLRLCLRPLSIACLPGVEVNSRQHLLRAMGNMASNTVNQMAFCPPPPTYRKEDVNMWIETDKGHRLPAFHIRKGHPLTILVSHANAEDLGIVLGFWSYMSDALQVDVFAYEYSGYGHSTGTPSEEHMYSDAKAALQLLVDGFKLKPERDIVLYGKSIGTCPTCYLAGRHRFRGVMLISGLASGSRVLFPTTKFSPMDMLYFNNIGRLAHSKSPTQVVHGTHDEVIPFSNGHDLHAACSKYHPLPVRMLPSFASWLGVPTLAADRVHAISSPAVSHPRSLHG